MKEEKTIFKPLAGIEPHIFGLLVRRVNHYTTRTNHTGRRVKTLEDAEWKTAIKKPVSPMQAWKVDVQNVNDDDDDHHRHHHHDILMQGEYFVTTFEFVAFSH